MSDPQGLDRLGVRGLMLWRDAAADSMTPAEREILLEACRTADRLERLDEILSGSVDTWLVLKLPDGDDEIKVNVSGVLSEARQQQNIFKQLVASLRLPDESTGKRPQHRGARGSYQPKGSGSAGSGGTVTAIERARARAGGA